MNFPLKAQGQNFSGFQKALHSTSFSSSAKEGKQFPGKVQKKGGSKKKLTKEMVENEFCLSWNGGKCAIAPSKTCWHKNICMICGRDHMAVKCPTLNNK